MEDNLAGRLPLEHRTDELKLTQLEYIRVGWGNTGVLQENMIISFSLFRVKFSQNNNKQ
jgi:hypothetical protein